MVLGWFRLVENSLNCVDVIFGCITIFVLSGKTGSLIVLDGPELNGALFISVNLVLFDMDI
jgi:hypothetical protein